MNDWESFIEEASAEARKTLGPRERKIKSEGVYVFAWRVLDFAEHMHEARKRGDIDSAMNFLFLACDAFMHMQVLRDVPEYNGWSVPAKQLTRDANRGIKGIRSDRKATKKGAPTISRLKGDVTKEKLKAELLRRNATPYTRGIAKQLVGTHGLPSSEVHMRRLLVALRSK
jgi:hypothetical protein